MIICLNDAAEDRDPDGGDRKAGRSGDQRLLLAGIVESLGDACMAIDAEGTFLLVNDAARRIFAHAVVGQRVSSNWATLHRSRRPDGSEMPSSEGALMRGLRGLETNDLVSTLQRPDAESLVWVEANGRPIHDGAGRVAGAVATYRDVTDRKRRADLQQRSEQIYRAIVQHLPRRDRCAPRRPGAGRRTRHRHARTRNAANDDRPCRGRDCPSGLRPAHHRGQPALCRSSWGPPDGHRRDAA